MKKLFILNESERDRILMMHTSATSRQYLNEQDSNVDYNDIKNKLQAAAGDVDTDEDDLVNVFKSIPKITFEQLKQAVFNLYKEYSGGDVDAEFSFFGDNTDIKNKIQSANDITELVSILDGLGFSENEAYDFIFDAILK